MEAWEASCGSDAAQQESASDWLTAWPMLFVAPLRMGQAALRVQHDIRASAVVSHPAHGRQPPARRPSVRTVAAMRRKETHTVGRMIRRLVGVN
jgi:hypothetical protein